MFQLYKIKIKNLLKCQTFSGMAKKSLVYRLQFVSPAVSEQNNSHSTYCQVNKSQEIPGCKPTLIDVFFFLFSFSIPFSQELWETWIGLLKESKTHAKWPEHLSFQGEDFKYTYCLFGWLHHILRIFGHRVSAWYNNMYTICTFIEFLKWVFCNGFFPQAIPDTKLTIKKYADAKFEYLVSLCCLFWD